MLAAIKLVISENGKLLETVTKETLTEPSQLIRSLEDFQHSANAAMTQLIEAQGNSGTLYNDVADEDDDGDEDEDEEEQVSPNKIKKVNCYFNVDC